MKVMEYLPSIILIVLVIAVVVIAIYPKVWPLAKSFLGLNAAIILSMEEVRGIADGFFESYKNCVESEDDNCKCVFNLNLEKGYVIRILRRESGVRVMLMEGNLRKSKLNKIVGDIEEDIMPCIYTDKIEKADSLDFGKTRKVDKLKIAGKTYELPEQLILYKSDKDVCIVPFKEGRKEFNVENILNLKTCGEEKKEKREPIVGEVEEEELIVV